ncbi:MAG: polysaccharide biosynthesis C-terminal domain-containing protein [Cyclobacteriaceae bacterium]|nr:polysaccharide biosynthesis C-terminal domain-containing protein [Cyclobacteriaceae bacterium]
MSKIKRLAGETAIYGLGSILPRVINFVLILPHTSVFHPAEYGVITDVYAWVAFLNVLYTFGMETAFFRFATKEGANPNTVFNTAQTAVTLITLALSTFFIVFAGPLAAEMDIPDHPDYIVWLTCIVAIDALVAIPFARLRLEKKATRFALFRIINVLVIVVLNFYFLKVDYDPNIGVAYVFLINLLANALYILFFIPVFIRWRPAFEKGLFYAMLVYAFPVMLTGLAGTTNEMFSRITLREWLPENFYPGRSSSYALGVFGANYKFAVFMNLVIQAFRFAAEPFFFSNAREKNSRHLFAMVNHYFVVTCCILLLAIGVNLDVLKIFLRSEAYWEGLPVVPILLTAYLFLGIYYNLSVWFKLTDRTYYGTIISLGGAAVTIIANYVLIPVAGYVGSSWAALICYFSVAAACYLTGKRFYPIPYRVGTDLAYIVLTVLLVYGVNALPFEGVAAFVVHNVIVLAVAGLVFLGERKGLKEAVNL